MIEKAKTASLVNGITKCGNCFLSSQGYIWCSHACKGLTHFNKSARVEQVEVSAQHSHHDKENIKQTMEQHILNLVETYTKHGTSQHKSQ